MGAGRLTWRCWIVAPSMPIPPTRSSVRAVSNASWLTPAGETPVSERSSARRLAMGKIWRTPAEVTRGQRARLSVSSEERPGRKMREMDVINGGFGVSHRLCTTVSKRHSFEESVAHFGPSKCLFLSQEARQYRAESRNTSN